MFNYKFKLYSISLIVVWAVLLVKTVDVPIYIGPNPEFVGWARMLTYCNLIALLSGAMLVIALYSLLQLRHRFLGSPNSLTIRITEVSDRSYEYVNALATVATLIGVILVPIASFRDLIVFALLMTAISVCYMNTNLYYSNPIFAALGFRLYSVKSGSEAFPDDSVAVIHDKLKTGDAVVIYHISDNVYYLKK